MSHVINSRALTGEKPCINKAINARLRSFQYDRTGNYFREISVKRRNKIVQEITRNVANVLSFYAIIAMEHVFFFQCNNIRQVPWELLKTAAFGLGFQHLPLDLANVNT